MADRLRFTVLGCGSSPGVPRPNGDWGNCDPSNPKNRRRRSALMVERIKPDGATTRIIIDTGPDFRDQMIVAGVESIDAVVYTHPHADHIHGVDDLRTFVMDSKSLMDVYANRLTLDRLHEAFGYCFITPAGSSYPPILKAHEIDHEAEFTIDGAGGAISLLPLPMIHGDIICLGYRIGNMAYCSDVSDFPVATTKLLENLDLLIIDALQYKAHPSHFNLAQALEWIERLSPKHAVLTHMHIPLDYAAVAQIIPSNVEPAYDGLSIELDA